MAGNGKELDALENTMLAAHPSTSAQEMKAPPPPSTRAQEVQADPSTETYDAMMRGRDTVAMLRDMARYNNEVADAIERTLAAWHGHTIRLMGQVGK